MRTGSVNASLYRVYVLAESSATYTRPLSYTPYLCLCLSPLSHRNWEQRRSKELRPELTVRNEYLRFDSDCQPSYLRRARNLAGSSRIQKKLPLLIAERKPRYTQPQWIQGYFLFAWMSEEIVNRPIGTARGCVGVTVSVCESA